MEGQSAKISNFYKVSALPPGPPPLRDGLDSSIGVLASAAEDAEGVPAPLLVIDVTGVRLHHDLQQPAQMCLLRSPVLRRPVLRGACTGWSEIVILAKLKIPFSDLSDTPTSPT